MKKFEHPILCHKGLKLRVGFCLVGLPSSHSAKFQNSKITKLRVENPGIIN